MSTAHESSAQQGERARRTQRITEPGIAAATRRAKRTGDAQWLREPAALHGAGRWEVRVTAQGAPRAYWRGQLRGRRDTKALGVIGRELSIPEARKKATELGQALRKGGRQAVDDARPITTTREGGGTLEKLIYAYADQLEARGKKRSAQDVRSAVRTHISTKRLAKMRAASVEPQELADLLRPLVSARKMRMAAKVRSHLRAAYALALAARLDASVSPALAGFAVKHNPAAALPTIRGGSGKRGNAHLEERDLRAFLRELRAFESTGADAVRLALWLGGQRAQQVARLRVADVVGGEIRLLDPKGRREQPREHWLPLVGRAKKIVAARAAAAGEGDAEHLFASVDTRTGELAHVRSESMNEVVKAARDAAQARGHRFGAAAKGFTLEALRRTGETLLAGMGVSKDLRAQLLSHGLAGVQSAHYDRHEYRKEKAAALSKWARYLERLARA